MQSTIRLVSAGSKYYGTLTGGAGRLFVKGVCNELQLLDRVPPQIRTDSSADRAMETRKGLPRDSGALVERENTEERAYHGAGELERCSDELSLRTLAEHADERTQPGIP